MSLTSMTVTCASTGELDQFDAAWAGMTQTAKDALAAVDQEFANMTVDQFWGARATRENILSVEGQWVSQHPMPTEVIDELEAACPDLISYDGDIIVEE